MPKIFGKEVSWVILGPASVLGLYLVYSTLAPAPPPVATTTVKKKAKTVATNTAFTEEDKTAKFASFTEEPKNVYRPLIVKQTPPAGAAALPPLGFNSKNTDGEAGWGYTGYVVLNSKPQGLLENPGTGDALYVQKGDVWKHSKIQELTPEYIVLTGPGGTQKVKLGEVSEPKKAAGVVPGGAPITPVNPGPALAGAIGNGAPVAGIPGNGNPAVANNNNGNGTNPVTDLSVQPDNTFQGRGRGRGGRRNRGGGGGFGGGGNGGFPNE